MGCQALKCPAWNMGTKSEEEFSGHNTWKLDLAGMGFGARFGVYYHVPCLRLHFTYFNADRYPQQRIFTGVIEYDDYGMRTATLIQDDAVVWRKVFDPSQTGAEPHDYLYRIHASKLVDYLREKATDNSWISVINPETWKEW